MSVKLVRKKKSEIVFFLSTAVKGIRCLLLGGDLDDSWFVDDASRAVSFFNDADDPSLISFLLLDVFAVGGSLLARQADEQPSGRFGRVALQQLEHVAASLCNGCHFRNHRQVVDHKRNLVFLMRSEGLSVTQQSEASDVCGSVSVVFVHETRGRSVQTSHRIHCTMICLANVFLRDHQLEEDRNCKIAFTFNSLISP